MNHRRELKKYIKRARKIGFSIKEITDSLLAAGWTQKDIKNSFEAVGRSSFLNLPRVLFAFIFDIFSELGSIFKCDVVVLEKAGVKAKKESFFIFDKLHLLWHYFIRSLEGIFDFFELLFSPFVKAAHLPFLIFSFGAPKKKNLLKNAPTGPLPSREPEYDASMISKMSFSGKLSFFDAFFLATRMFEPKRSRMFLLIFGLALGFSLLLFFGYFFSGFDVLLLEKIYNEARTQGGLHSVALSDTLEQVKSSLYIGSLGLGIFGALLILLFFIGLANVLKVTLRERKKEVDAVIMIGASKKDIFRLFFVESVIMAFFGGAGGVVAGYFSAFFINYGINILAGDHVEGSLNLFYYPLWFTDSVFVFSFILGYVAASWSKNKLKIRDIIITKDKKL